MQTIYFLPFLLASFIGALACLVVRRWRRYVAAAIVAPVAFAVCSIAGLMLTILLAESLGVSGVLGFDTRAEDRSWGGSAVLVSLYGLLGAFGAWIASSVANWLQRTLG